MVLESDPMMNRTHALTGAAVYLPTAPLLEVAGWHLAAGTLLAAYCATCPDWDHPGSSTARRFGPLGRLLAKGIAKVA